MTMKKVIVIVGPTGSGKTKLSIALAKQIGAEIINGDSVQVYQGLDVGSAKIKPEETKGVMHHLLSMIPVNAQYSVYHFQKDARQLIDQIQYPMIVGGTGLYIKATLYDYRFLDQGRNQAFEDLYASDDNQALFEKLKELDPGATIDIGNRRRILRALEQALSGDLRSEKNQKDQLLYRPLILYLDVDRHVLESRLVNRLDKQLEDGFLEEALHLFNQNISINAIGYRELRLYLEGHYGLDEAKKRIIKVSKALAKKQKTWFKNQMEPIILDADAPNLFEIAHGHVLTFLKEK